MRFKTFFIFRPINYSKKIRQYFILIFLSVMNIFFIPQASATISPAMSLIQAYLTTHPIDRQAMKLTQNEILQKLKQESEKLETGIPNFKPQAITLPTIYPVSSKKLSPGKVKKRKTPLVLPQPIFIVGADDQSKAWLIHYERQLQHLHAKGFVVNVENAAAMQSLQKIVPHLPLLALPGDALATALPLQHYPVLIRDHWIEQ